MTYFLMLIFLNGFFDNSSCAMAGRSGASFINPAGLGITPGFEFLWVGGFDNNQNIGVSLKNLGFGLKYINKDSITYYAGSGYKFKVNGMPLYFGSVWRYHNNWTYGIGSIFRPKRFVSIGITSEIKKKPQLRIGVGLRPITDRFTLFFDASYKDSINDYLYGFGYEPMDGIILSFTRNKNKDISLSLGISFGKFKFGGSGIKSNIDEYKGNLSVLASKEPYPTFIKKKKKLVNLTIEGSYPEMKDESKYFGLLTRREPSFYNLLKNIETLKQRKDCAGLFIHFKKWRLGIAQAEELRTALLDFKKSGKKIITYSNDYGLGRLYLSSIADKIILTPLGDVTIPGLMARMLYLKGTLDKLGIETDIEKVGKYKSATEIFERKDMSDADREQLNALLDDIYEPIVKKIAISRGMSEEKMEELIDNGVFFNSENAVKEGLVDATAFYCELDSVVKNFIGEKIKREGISKFLHKNEVKREWRKKEREKIALVIAEGNIVTGKSGVDPTPLMGGKYIGSETVSKIAEKLRRDKSVKAVVFRVNSGGGGALASEIIANSIKRLAREKPVIVSMGNVAGSGGYYIACFGNKILADRFTITGSIGVLSLNFIMKGLYDKLGISYDQVLKGKHADYFSDLRHMTPDERERFRKETRWYYDKFLERVAEGRDTTTSYIDSIGQGRIWSGTRAEKIGLIDKTGGVLDAINLAKREAGIKKEPELVVYPRPKRSFSLRIGPSFRLLESRYLYIMPYKVMIDW